MIGIKTCLNRSIYLISTFPNSLLSYVLPFPPFLSLTVKLLYAFVSDTYPLCGRKRKPYLCIGIVSCCLSWCLLGSIRPPPTTTLTCVLMFFATFGLLMSDVMADALVVEKVALERTNTKTNESEVGTTQTSVWALRFIGSFIGKP